MGENVFLAVSVLVIASAFWVVFSPNLIHSAVSLLFTLFGIAGLYIFLYADFIAGTQVVVYVGGISILVGSVGLLFLLGFVSSVFGVYIYAIMLGVGYSATASLVPAMMSDRFSGLYFGSIIGIGLFGSAAGSAIGPWLAGYVFDHTGTYDLAFAIAAICGVIAGWAGWVARSIRLRQAL